MTRSVPRRAVVVPLALVLLLVAVAGAVLVRQLAGNDAPARLTVGWGGGEGDPACAYDESTGTVAAQVRVEGRTPRRDRLVVTVTAYADENTSEPVGSASRAVDADGRVRLRLGLTIPVSRAPHLDDDGIAACRLAVRDDLDLARVGAL